MQPVDLLSSTRPPAIHLIEMNIDAFGNLARSLSAGAPRAIVRTIRGRKSRTVADFFDESAAALQFPPILERTGMRSTRCSSTSTGSSGTPICFS